MTDRYRYEDALHQVIKALLRQYVEDNGDAWVDVESFQELTYRVSNDELRQADNFTLNVAVHEHVDPTTRHVTLRLLRRASNTPEAT